jgi:hypothetical protein
MTLLALVIWCLTVASVVLYVHLFKHREPPERVRRGRLIAHSGSIWRAK